jgi:thioredoxin-like negative regulator of GroEL
MAVAGLLLAGTAQAGEPDLAKAEQLLKEGQAAEAVALFEQALEADPSSVGAHLGLGRALYAAGEYARADRIRVRAEVRQPAARHAELDRGL